jgi:hypothetical protein
MSQFRLKFRITLTPVQGVICIGYRLQVGEDGSLT